MSSGSRSWTSMITASPSFRSQVSWRRAYRRVAAAICSAVSSRVSSPVQMPADLRIADGAADARPARPAVASRPCSSRKRRTSSTAPSSTHAAGPGVDARDRTPLAPARVPRPAWGGRSAGSTGRPARTTLCLPTSDSLQRADHAAGVPRVDCAGRRRVQARQLGVERGRRLRPPRAPPGAPAARGRPAATASGASAARRYKPVPPASSGRPRAASISAIKGRACAAYSAAENAPLGSTTPTSACSTAARLRRRGLVGEHGEAPIDLHGIAGDHPRPDDARAAARVLPPGTEGRRAGLVPRAQQPTDLVQAPAQAAWPAGPRGRGRCSPRRSPYLPPAEARGGRLEQLHLHQVARQPPPTGSSPACAPASAP